MSLVSGQFLLGDASGAENKPDATSSLCVTRPGEEVIPASNLECAPWFCH